MEFLIGATYGNRDTEYEVLSIKGDTLVVRYNDGKTAELSKKIQERIIENIEYEKRVLEPSKDPEENKAYFRTVGFLAKNATLIEGFAPPISVPGFSRDYLRITGRRAEDEETFYQHDEGTDKWGVELRIEFPNPSPGVKPFYGIGVSTVSAPSGELRVNNNSFVKQLFELGFIFGLRQDIERIRGRIPDEHLSEFNENCQ